jgi:hypothetical protein
MNLASQDTTDCKTPRVFLVLQELTQLKKESHLALHVLQDLTWDKVQARFVILVMLDDIRTPVDSQPVLLVILVHMLHLLQVLHVSNVLWLPTASSASALPAMFAQKVVGRTRMDPQPVSNAKKTRTLYVLKVLLFHGLEMVCSERQISLAISTPVFLQKLVYLLGLETPAVLLLIKELSVRSAHPVTFAMLEDVSSAFLLLRDGQHSSF